MLDALYNFQIFKHRKGRPDADGPQCIGAIEDYHDTDVTDNTMNTQNPPFISRRFPLNTAKFPLSSGSPARADPFRRSQSPIRREPSRVPIKRPLPKYSQDAPLDICEFGFEFD